MPRIILEVTLESGEYHNIEDMKEEAIAAIHEVFTETDLVEDFDSVDIECTFAELTDDDKDIVRFQGESGKDD